MHPKIQSNVLCRNGIRFYMIENTNCRRSGDGLKNKSGTANKKRENVVLILSLAASKNLKTLPQSFIDKLGLTLLPMSRDGMVQAKAQGGKEMWYLLQTVIAPKQKLATANSLQSANRFAPAAPFPPAPD